jgi:hypothetical protein
MVAQGKVTTDRKVIEKWIKSRNGWPAIKRQITSNGVEVILSIVFPDSEAVDIIRMLSWDEFFEKFNQQKLVFVYEENGYKINSSHSYAFV